MSWFSRSLVSLAYLVLSTCLVFLFSFMVPSLGHLQDLDLPGGGWIDLDLWAPWIMVSTAPLIGLLFLLEVKLAFFQGSKGLGGRAFLYFGVLWGERVLFILRGIGNPTILLVLVLCLLWIGLFLTAVRYLGSEALIKESAEGFGREGLGIQFFWVAVFFSFAIQVVLKGYGVSGGVQALVFLGLSYWEFRKLRGSGLLSERVERVFLWIYRSALIVLPLILLFKL